MNEPELDPAPMTRKEALSAPAVIGKAVALFLALATAAALLIGAGEWKGHIEEKVAGYTEKVVALDAKVQPLETEAQDSKRDRDDIHLQVNAIKEADDKSLENLRADMNRRFDRQMDRLDKISDRLGVPSANAPARP